MQLPIGKVPTPDEILDVAFSRARKAALESRREVRGSPIIKMKKEDTTRLQSAAANIREQLQFIQRSFPTFDHLAPFYQELVKITIDYPYLKQSLGSLPWAEQQVQKFFRQFAAQIRSARDASHLEKLKKAAFGRISSVLKQIKPNLKYLEEVRKTLREFPTIKTSLPTVVIAGFPNVGKTSVLKALTGSAPEISSYPFTTKQLMLGYKELTVGRVQFVDTPGLLDRPVHMRNPIELKAVLALKHLAKIVLFVVDPTQSSGYSLDLQKKLYKDVRQLLRVPMIVVLNKSDLASQEELENAKQEFPNAISVSASANELAGLDGEIAASLSKTSKPQQEGTQ